MVSDDKLTPHLPCPLSLAPAVGSPRMWSLGVRWAGSEAGGWAGEGGWMLHVSGGHWDVGDVEGGGVRGSSDGCDAMVVVVWGRARVAMAEEAVSK